MELPYVFLQSLIFGTLVYSMVQFEWTPAKFLLFLFFLYFTLLVFTYWGMLTVALTPNAQVAAIISSAAFGIWNLFAGFLVPRPVSPFFFFLGCLITSKKLSLIYLMLKKLHGLITLNRVFSVGCPMNLKEIEILLFKKGYKIALSSIK